jgi:hypothetical protein
MRLANLLHFYVETLILVFYNISSSIVSRIYPVMISWSCSIKPYVSARSCRVSLFILTSTQTRKKLVCLIIGKLEQSFYFLNWIVAVALHHASDKLYKNCSKPTPVALSLL